MLAIKLSIALRQGNQRAAHQALELIDMKKAAEESPAENAGNALPLLIAPEEATPDSD